MRIGKINRVTKETDVTVEINLDCAELDNNNVSVIVYHEGDGNEIIYGYDENVTLKIFGNYTKQTSGEDVIIKVGNGTITVKEAKDKILNICSEDDNETNTDDNGNEYVYNYFGGHCTICSGAGEDTIYNCAESQRIFSEAEVSSGIGFFDHMLNLFAAHGQFGLKVVCKGDLEVDGHHSVEDIGIALGGALKEALGEKRGITRYGTFFLPMDETLALVSLDISGRPFLVCELGELAPMIGNFDTELVEEFLRAFAFNAGITLHVKIFYGKNSHHKVEAIFKALGHALRAAVNVDKKNKDVPSTKGVL